MTAFLLSILFVCAPIQTGAGAVVTDSPTVQPTRFSSRQELPPLQPPPRDLPSQVIRPALVQDQPSAEVQLRLNDESFQSSTRGVPAPPVERTASIPPVVRPLENHNAGPDTLVVCPPVFNDGITGVAPLSGTTGSPNSGREATG